MVKASKGISPRVHRGFVDPAVGQQTLAFGQPLAARSSRLRKSPFHRGGYVDGNAERLLEQLFLPFRPPDLQFQVLPPHPSRNEPYGFVADENADRPDVRLVIPVQSVGNTQDC